MASFIQIAIVFALVLGAMIVIHEFGHFIVAKFFGVRVEVFSIGLGKRIWGLKRGDTDYRLSLIPVGGYVKMAGESLDEQSTGAPDEFMSKPKWQRFCIAIAGPAMNILTALAIPATLAMIHHEVPSFQNQPALIQAIEANSSAEQAGLRPGDLIVEIDGQTDPTWRDVDDAVAVSPDQMIPVTIRRDGQESRIQLQVGSRQFEQEKIGYAGLKPVDTKLLVGDVNQGEPAAEAGLQPGDRLVAINGTQLDQNHFGRDALIGAIQSSEGREVALTVNRNGQLIDIKATPRQIEGYPRLGFRPELSGIEMIVVRLSPVQALAYSVDWNLRILRLTGKAVGQIFEQKRSARDTLTGPVGIARLTGQAAEQGAWSVFTLTAVLSLNLGIFNLLPIPVLDGGLIFMLVLEAILGLFGLPLTLRIKEKMMQVGFVVLMLLMGFVIFNDISKLIPGRSTQPAQQSEQARPDRE